MRCSCLLLLLSLPLTSCSSVADHADARPGPDAGPRGEDLGGATPDLGVLHDLTELTIEGKVLLDFAEPGPGVQVTTHCGELKVEATTDDGGAFRLSSDVRTCNQLVVEFRKESYLPVLRVVHLPPPASPVTMNVAMTGLKELQCGSERCVVVGDPISSFPPRPITRGWVAVLGGPTAADYLGGEFRDRDGDILWVTGFGYFDLRDDQGATLTSFPPFDECFSVGDDALDQIVDAVPATDELETTLYTLDESNGRWTSLGPIGYVSYTDGMAGALPVIKKATRAQKDDIRSNQLHKGVWICAPLSGSGWLAWGVSIRQRSCVQLQVTNQCGVPLPNVVFELRGKDYAYLASTWSDRRGSACLEAARSEELGADFNGNEVLGETFWVTAELSWNGAKEPFPSWEILRAGQDAVVDCAHPTSCRPLTYSYQDFTDPECKR